MATQEQKSPGLEVVRKRAGLKKPFIIHRCPRHVAKEVKGKVMREEQVKFESTLSGPVRKHSVSVLGEARGHWMEWWMCESNASGKLARFFTNSFQKKKGFLPRCSFHCQWPEQPVFAMALHSFEMCSAKTYHHISHRKRRKIQ